MILLIAILIAVLMLAAFFVCIIFGFEEAAKVFICVCIAILISVFIAVIIIALAAKIYCLA